MQNSSSLSRSVLVASIAALYFTGCSANGSQFNPAPAPATTLQQVTKMQPDQVIGGGSFYIASGNCVAYYVYNVHTQEWDVHYFPEGCQFWFAGPNNGLGYVTATNDWLVGESTSGTNVIAVENAKGKQIGTLTGLTGEPVGIATDSKGDIWATNSPSNAISEYYAGATEPSATFTDGNLSSVRYIAVDQNNNVYVSGQSAGSGNLEVDKLEASAFIPIKTITGVVGAGIAVSPKSQMLWVCDEGNGTSGTISGYTMPGFKRRMQIAYSGDDTGIAVAKTGKQLYAVDNVADGSQFDVSVVVYDARTGKEVNSTPATITSAKVLGISHK
jgi:hypothetical protein